ncbi:MAG TPA: hypothetical protein VLH61_12320 [Bacteroidales bacterium]|nr:hypothetical protein [Bacteroidales bacterium]
MGAFFFFLAIGALAGAPLMGAWLAGRPLETFLVLPPMTTSIYLEKAPFSWPAFFIIAALVLLVMVPFILRVLNSQKVVQQLPKAGRNFPWWGWLGLAIMLAGWIAAWTRIPWLAPVQTFTFTPPWIGFIILVNAITFMRTGKSLITHRPVYLVSMFVFSAVFWWYFEYLNLLVENWFYVNVGVYNPVRFFWYATLPFSTVLPAVISTTYLIESYPRLTTGLQNFLTIRPAKPAVFIWVSLAAGTAGMVLISFFPDYLFPFLWFAPTAIIGSLMALRGNTELFTPLASGNWVRLYSLALAALVCGFFWEMWNYHSLTKWVYSIPLVHRFLIFEMPVLGYAGYLPFGLQCGLAASLLNHLYQKIKGAYKAPSAKCSF